MKPLLHIQSVPISIEYNVTPARMEMVQQKTNLNVTRTKNGLTIESTPIKIKLDTFEARSSMGLKSVATAVAENAHKGNQLTYEAIGKIVEDGNFMMDIHINRTPVPDLAMRNMPLEVDTMMAFTPSTGPEISWEGPDLQMRYEMDQLAFDWRTNRPEMTFIPGSIEFQIKEYPRLIIEYVGEPIYVPPSSNPDYVPPALDIEV